METLNDIGEDALIERLVALVPVGQSLEGPGDDCAVVDEGGGMLLLLKTDALVEGVHFLKDADAEQVGWKAVARVVSDFAAMGGWPERFLVTVALPNSMEVAWIEGFYRGMGRCFEKFGAVLAGGETCRVPAGSAAVISIAATGKVERENLITRSGGKTGDELWVTGELGGSLGGKHLTFYPRVTEARWLAECFKPSAMMDLSDGVARDLPRLAKASGCGFKIDKDKVPETEGCGIDEALGDGEDFELMFTIADSSGLEEAWGEQFPGLRLSKIGRLVDAGEGDELSGGWDHFGPPGN